MIIFKAVFTAFLLLMKLMCYILVLLGKVVVIILKGTLICVAKLLTPVPKQMSKKAEVKRIEKKETKKEKVIDEKERLAALSQLEAWENQLSANHAYMRELDKELEQARKSYETVINGIIVTVNPDKMKIAKIMKKISAVETQSAGVDMKIKKLANKYNLQDELEEYEGE